MIDYFWFVNQFNISRIFNYPSILIGSLQIFLKIKENSWQEIYPSILIYSASNEFILKEKGDKTMKKVLLSSVATLAVF